LRRIQAQLDALEAEVGLALQVRHAELSSRLARDASGPAR
jgi:hypothetical protein